MLGACGTPIDKKLSMSSSPCATLGGDPSVAEGDSRLAQHNPISHFPTGADTVDDVAGLPLADGEGPQEGGMGGLDFFGERDGPVVEGIVFEEVSRMGGCGGVQQRGRVLLFGSVSVECGFGTGKELIDVDSNPATV